MTYVHDQLAGKAIELLKDAAPWVSRVAILWNPDHTDPEFRETQRGAQTLSFHSNGWKCGNRPILRVRSRRHCASGQRPSSFSGLNFVIAPAAIGKSRQGTNSF